MSCGGGIRLRDRICIGGESGGDGCEGSEFDINACSTQVSLLEMFYSFLYPHVCLNFLAFLVKKTFCFYIEIMFIDLGSNLTI